MATTVEGAKGIGVAALRKEDRRFLTGRGRYVDDIKLPGMLHMAVVRSQYAHADINGIDTSAASAMPGVTAVLTGDGSRVRRRRAVRVEPHRRHGAAAPAAARKGQGAPRRRADRGRDRRRPLRRPRRGGRGRGRLRAAARSCSGSTPRWPTARRRIHEELDSNVGLVLTTQDRRYRCGLRQGRRRREAHDPKPAPDPCPDRDTRRGGRLEPGLGRPGRLQLDPDPPLPAHVPRDRVRGERGQGARDRAGRRRRVRRQAEHLRRGVHRRGRVPQGGRAGEVDRGALRGHGRDLPRPRPGRARRARGDEATARCWACACTTSRTTAHTCSC